MYAKVLENLKGKLVSELKQRNEILAKIQLRQVETVEIRKEVNELMVKSRLISEEDVQQIMADYKDTTPDLPEETPVNEDKMVAKLANIIKTSKKKVKVKKKKSGNQSGVPSSKNTFNSRRKGQASPAKESSVDKSFAKSEVSKQSLGDKSGKHTFTSISHNVISISITIICRSKFGLYRFRETFCIKTRDQAQYHGRQEAGD